MSARRVVHKSRVYKGQWGATVATTLCARHRLAMNVSSQSEEVSCKFCLRLMGLRAAPQRTPSEEAQK